VAACSPSLASPVVENADTSGRRESVRFESVSRVRLVPWRILWSVAQTESYFAPNQQQGGEPCRQPKTCGGGSAAPKRKTAADSAARNSRRLFPDLNFADFAGGVDKGYFA
jgi:hypothetical protein